MRFWSIEEGFIVISNAYGACCVVKAQNSIILACCILHNYLTSMDLDEDLITKVDAELARQEVTYDEYYTHRSNNDDTGLGERLRDELSAVMRRDYT